MPTPRPIIEARIGVIVLKSVKPAAIVRIPMPSATARIARMIGISAGSSVPNTISRMMIATAMPISSEAPCLGCSCTAWPV